MISRDLESIVTQAAKTYPVVTIVGPRQAGKTTLCKMVFSKYTYANLEHPEIRLLAQQDPKSFFRQFPKPLIIDEIQRVPELLSYIQVIVDEEKENGQFIITGSQQLHLSASISQSLAGRTAILTLLPFSFGEIKKMGASIERDQLIFKGFLPRIYDQKQSPTMAYRNYVQTYVERDLRQLLQVKDLTLFIKFLQLLAGRVGQLINLNSISNDLGVSSANLSNWLSILETSYIIFRLAPYYNNFGKRAIKSPKIYFYETGLLTYLLGIEDEKQIGRDPLLGNLFENMIVTEAVKSKLNKGLDPNLFFYRDSNQNEIDLLVKKGTELIPIEIKAAMTYNDELLKGLKKMSSLIKSENRYLIYSGDLNFTTKDNIQVLSFQNLSQIF